MKMRVRILRKFDFLKNLKYHTPGSAGLDLCAATDEDIVLQAGGVTVVPSGIAIELPNGYEAQIRSRSGLTFRNQIIVLNAPATIDNDFRGEICIILKNHSDEDFTIKPGMRIAQMVLSRYEQAELEFADTLSDTERGDNGFGSTGI